MLGSARVGPLPLLFFLNWSFFFLSCRLITWGSLGAREVIVCDVTDSEKLCLAFSGGACRESLRDFDSLSTSKTFCFCESALSENHFCPGLGSVPIDIIFDVVMASVFAPVFVFFLPHLKVVDVLLRDLGIAPFPSAVGDLDRAG